MKFSKYQGLGNDFILFDLSVTSDASEYGSEFIRNICDRRYGIGADGILLFETDKDRSAVRMVYYNADGRRAETCFNGLRCIALHAVRSGTRQRGAEFRILTDAGDVKSFVDRNHDLVRMTMEGPKFVAGSEEDLEFSFGLLTGLTLSLGNPHFVVWQEDSDLHELNTRVMALGSEVETAPHFRDRTNFEIASLHNPHEINIAVWERGVGRTLACGSGATAAVCAGVKTGRLNAETQIVVAMEGGELEIAVSREMDRITVKGAATHVFSGEFDPENFISTGFPIQ